MKSLVLAVPAVLLLTSCAAYRAQHQSPAMATTAPAAAAASHDSHETAPASDATPGPSAAAMHTGLVDMRQAMLLSEIDKYIGELTADGKYDCCVKPACRQCAITAGECHCREVVTSDGPCCGECTQAWVEGKGNIEGVDREQVLEHLGCVRSLYEKKVPEGMAAPAQRKPD